MFFSNQQPYAIKEHTEYHERKPYKYVKITREDETLFVIYDGDFYSVRSLLCNENYIVEVKLISPYVFMAKAFSKDYVSLRNYKTSSFTFTEDLKITFDGFESMKLKAESESFHKKIKKDGWVVI